MVPFGPHTAAAIDRYLRSRRSHRLAGTTALWLGVGGKGFGYHGLNDALRERARAAGIDGFRIDLMRHTAATRWLRAGGPDSRADGGRRLDQPQHAGPLHRRQRVRAGRRRKRGHAGLGDL